eukprot:3051025-Alexandrium_andersonii.AAC.1
MAPDAPCGARQPGCVVDPAQAAAEWYRVAATLKKRAVKLQVETPYPKNLMPQDVWLKLAKAADEWRFKAGLTGTADLLRRDERPRLDHPTTE